MKEVRTNILSKLLAILTGIIFLNMSFFLTELRVLELDVANHDLVVNIVKMISGVGFEEEKDCMGESSESGSFEQIVDLHITVQSESLSGYYLISNNLYLFSQSHLFKSAVHEIATPPPKIS
jgi:hypothetical protein